MRPRAVIAAVLVAGPPVAAACGREAAATQRPAARAADRPDRGRVCDSARAARVALDSLARLDPFRSAVLRFERDTAGVRIVTWPVQPSAGRIADGMAVVRIGRDCRITSLVEADSA